MDRVHLRRAGVSLLLDLRDGDARIVHWGADLGEQIPGLAALEPSVPHSASDEPAAVSLLPQAARGWRGTPGTAGDRGSRDYSLRLVLQDAVADDARAELTLVDANAGIQVRATLALEPSGLLLVDQELTNTGETAYRVGALDVTLPLPSQATEALDLTGRWSREKHPQRKGIDQGTWTRTGRHGRTGHDSTLVIAAGTPGFGWRSGEVWAVHLGWSGDHTSRVERAGDGQKVLAVGELLHSGELVLEPGESYRAPRAFAAYSGSGLDGVSERFHEWVRARAGHPSTPRPVMLNTWEAVYFDHDLEVLRQLADAAADLGVERFVLDDGWFLGRRSDNAGLGDWFVDPDVWPQGLTPLIETVNSRGMQFGLWVEPEMINEDSELARTHPDWISGPGDRVPLRWRHQQVLDLVNPDAWQYIYDRLDALLTEYPIAYLKWDQNRDQPELGHDGRSSTHDQTLAAYRLFDALRAAHPDVEIESCSSGGGRVDLGILERTDRVWASDTNDALERQTIQRWTGLVLPPEIVGAHVGPATSHTTGRTHALSFRAITALFGHFGVEWDVRGLSDAEREELRRVIAFYKANRELIHTGRSVRVDRPDDTDSAYGVVAPDGSRALFAYVTLATSPDEAPGKLRVPGLDPDALYRVSLALPLDRHGFAGRALPSWLDDGQVTMSGRALEAIGLAMPLLRPERAILLEVAAQ
ncbi:alpha-galactosidase [Humibacter ginsenosidimutans]|uniref:alpha-galactosidase n=1 Tax=Humibacter ginsenosidimutans TaxID=2599293 RepID=A0A5B8M8K7_9MICO|nr:alpha-galactosidase [Humibacter ginsenosidimutans]QDZ16753.1 alpha-galactosidase [Humibacter ginsenosidimutans]